jgi:hypothetical protein
MRRFPIILEKIKGGEILTYYSGNKLKELRELSIILERI